MRHEAYARKKTIKNSEQDNEICYSTTASLWNTTKRTKSTEIEIRFDEKSFYVYVIRSLYI